MEYKIGNYVLQINREGTRIFNKNSKNDNLCDCTGCINFRKAIKDVEPDIKNIAKDFGIDLKQPIEVSVLYFKDNMIQYCGWYHIVGEIIEGKEPYI